MTALNILNILDDLMKLIHDSSSSDDTFDTILKSFRNDPSKFKNACIAYAFWLFKTSNELNCCLNSYKYFELLDTILILYGPNPDIVDIIDKSIGSVQQPFKSNSFPQTFDFGQFNDLKKRKNITILKDPSIIEFQKNILLPSVIEDLISDWPALKKWACPSFWIETAGHRFFPVEIGRDYEAEDWYQDIIQLFEYFSKYVFDTNNRTIAYIAQHNWLHQIPSLAQDFEIPDLCDLFLNTNQDKVLVHMWFGMKGTCSPLHFDKYNNIFSQVVGFKHFVLVDPKFSHIVSNGKDNTCKIDCNILDFLTENNIPYIELILKPGESLYIPSNWWHQVKSISFSISISFWF